MPQPSPSTLSLTLSTFEAQLGQLQAPRAAHAHRGLAHAAVAALQRGVRERHLGVAGTGVHLSDAARGLGHRGVGLSKVEGTRAIWGNLS